MLRKLNMALAALIGLTIMTVLVTARSSLVPSNSRDGDTEIVLEVPEAGELSGGNEVTAGPSALASAGAYTGIGARNVGGGLIAAPLSGEEPLERIEALPQPTPPSRPKAPEPVKSDKSLRWRLIYNSVISAAGVFDQNGTALVLPGIDIIPVNENCAAPNGVRWPCGMVARTAFRNFVKGRAITCRMPDVPLKEAYAAECLLAGQDMSAWLVEQGWARAKPDANYVELEAAAKGQQLGIHGNPPRGVEIVSDAGSASVLPTVDP